MASIMRKIACILLAGQSAAAGLTPQCSEPPLGVDYTGIKYYNGRVSCGNLLLEADIGGTHPWIPPNVTFAHASDDALYILMYIDPYVNVPNNGSWPTCGSACAGTKAPATRGTANRAATATLRRWNQPATKQVPLTYLPSTSMTCLTRT